MDAMTSRKTKADAPASPMREAYAAHVLAWLNECAGGAVLLDRDYREFRRRGLSRADVNRALDLLAQRGLVRLRADELGVFVEEMAAALAYDALEAEWRRQDDEALKGEKEVAG